MAHGGERLLKSFIPNLRELDKVRTEAVLILVKNATLLFRAGTTRLILFNFVQAEYLKRGFFTKKTGQNSERGNPYIEESLAGPF